MLDFAVSPQSLGSDNHAGVHPEVMAAMAHVNRGHMGSYGTDAITAQAQRLFKQHFGPAAEAYFVFNGTAANVLALQACMPPFASVLCAQSAHINSDACAAPERLVGCKVQGIPTPDGKLTPDAIDPYLVRFGDQHFAAPRMVSLSQPTELGTVYTVAELRTLVAHCHAHSLLVHMDGARLFHAAAGLDTSLAALSTDVGVDVLSLGGTKNGTMWGDAVIFLQGRAVPDFARYRKQDLQLAAKMRFVAAQFCALLSGDLWRRNAQHALAAAQYLRTALVPVGQIRLTQAVQANAVFATVPRAWVKPLRRTCFFYVWDQTAFEVRWITSFDTEFATIDRLVAHIKRLAEDDHG